MTTTPTTPIAVTGRLIMRRSWRRPRTPGCGTWSTPPVSSRGESGGHLPFAHILRNPSLHQGRADRLTGPEALAFEDVARIITEVEGRPVRFQDETVEEAYASRKVWSPPAWQADAWVSTYTAIAAGELDVVSGDIEQVTGRRRWTPGRSCRTAG